MRIKSPLSSLEISRIYAGSGKFTAPACKEGLKWETNTSTQFEIFFAEIPKKTI
jgi:hypothetical protein